MDNMEVVLAGVSMVGLGVATPERDMAMIDDGWLYREGGVGVSKNGL